ncbi:cytochrome c [Jatrophihabitans endophyticus]|uniref:cytochrome bc1 complex diheme cytochrome c subunit n=1 Tax=Jatrophihabitans endophyticus TaxID=1206085 RepID=UPI0019FC3A31|nr:cytochrome c [Jatrophihabitans endophyticus]MBE7188392.1 c-type cytochrome [Jatrophihabitans endophyticus]
MSDEVESTDAADELLDYGFEPAASVTGAASDSAFDSATERAGAEPRRRRLARRPSSTTSPSRPRSALRRRLGAGAVLLGALAAMGGAYATFATSSGASDSGQSASSVSAGRQLYDNSCITCHGANLEGVQGNGPSLVGVGSAAVYFQVSTGRMPLAQNGAYAAPHGINKYTEAQVEQLGSYVESVGGGPSVPKGSLEAASSTLGQGGELYRLNCASCHGTTFKGAPLAGGASAPSLNGATAKQIYAAMLSGPENMPIFGDNAVSPKEKREIVAYVQTLKASADPGGNGIDRIGPVSEAIVMWVGGVGAIMIAILWIGARNR